jgi:hypothetical protein
MRLGFVPMSGSSDRWLTRHRNSSDTAPSLRRLFSAFDATTDRSAPVPRIGTQVLAGPPLGRLPWHRHDRQVPYGGSYRTWGDRFPGSTRKLPIPLGSLREPAGHHQDKGYATVGWERGQAVCRANGHTHRPHAAFMPDAAAAVVRFPRGSSRANDNFPVSGYGPNLQGGPDLRATSPISFDTSSAVRFCSSCRPAPDAVHAAPFPVTLTTPTLDRSSPGASAPDQRRAPTRPVPAVRSLLLQADSEGPRVRPSLLSNSRSFILRAASPGTLSSDF